MTFKEFGYKYPNIDTKHYLYGDWRDIESAYTNITNVPLLDPDKYPTYSNDYIFDENKSVKWNREEVERLNNNSILL